MLSRETIGTRSLRRNAGEDDDAVQSADPHDKSTLTADAPVEPVEVVHCGDQGHSDSETKADGGSSGDECDILHTHTCTHKIGDGDEDDGNSCSAALRSIINEVVEIKNKLEREVGNFGQISQNMTGQLGTQGQGGKC